MRIASSDGAGTLLSGHKAVKTEKTAAPLPVATIQDLRARRRQLDREMERERTSGERPSPRYHERVAEYRSLGDLIRKRIERKIHDQPAEPSDQMITLRLTATQLAMLKQVARYDRHRFIEQAVVDAIRCHCIAHQAAACQVEEWEAEARFNGGKCPVRAPYPGSGPDGTRPKRKRASNAGEGTPHPCGILRV